jgi:hypothetical protein
MERWICESVSEWVRVSEREHCVNRWLTAVHEVNERRRQAARPVNIKRVTCLECLKASGHYSSHFCWSQ